MDDIVQRGVSSKGIGLGTGSGTGSGTVFGQGVCSGVLVTDVKVNIFSLFLHDVHIIPCHTISCHILLFYTIQYHIISCSHHTYRIISTTNILSFSQSSCLYLLFSSFTHVSYPIALPYYSQLIIFQFYSHISDNSSALRTFENLSHTPGKGPISTNFTNNGT